MKSTIRKRTYKAIYRLLNRVSPIPGDCGLLCSSACCMAEDAGADNLGIYLLPGEEKVFTGDRNWLSWTKERAEDYEFPDSWRGTIYFVKCKTPPSCRRELRPMQCRTFPLEPHIDKDGVLTLRYNSMELPYCCPLIDQEHPLDERFVKATYTVWKHLIKDPLIYDLVRMDSATSDAIKNE